MNKRTKEPTSRDAGTRPIDRKRLLNFLEEFSWLLASYSNTDFRSIPDVLRRELNREAEVSGGVGGYVSSNPNKHFLVGVLPRLLVDETLFPTNSDIAQFASTVMGVKILRYEKKSKFEIIGHLVCETDNLNDAKLARLVQALTGLTEGDAGTRDLVQERKRQNFGWNAIIQELATRTPQ